MSDLVQLAPTSPAGSALPSDDQGLTLTAVSVGEAVPRPERLRDAVRLLAIWAVRAAREEAPPADSTRPPMASRVLDHALDPMPGEQLR